MNSKGAYIPSEDEIEQSLLKVFRIVLIGGAFAFAIIMFFVALSKVPGSNGNVIVKSMVVAFDASSIGILMLSVTMRFWRFWRLYVIYTSVTIGLIIGVFWYFASPNHGIFDLFMIIWPGIKYYFILTTIFCPLLSILAAYSTYTNGRKKQA